MKLREEFDKRDAVIIILILITIGVIIWAGLRAGVCVEAMNIYNEGGEWMCKFCDELIAGGILNK